MESPQQARFELERRWSQQLAREYDYILWGLPIRLTPGLVRVEPMGSQWGSWNPALRVITISTRLIEKYTWDIVVEVLRHEVAHQIADERFYAQTPHGPEFAQAAALLGLPTWARMAGGALPDEIPRLSDRAVSDEEERLLGRVEKLLALATSDNEHEAAAAMERVRRLYARHNLEWTRSRSEREMVSLVIAPKKKRLGGHHVGIASILKTHFFVDVIFGRQFDAKDLCEYRIIELLGTPENVLMAEYVHSFLTHQIEALWQTYRKKTGKSAGSRTSYMRGVLHGFGEKLERSTAADDVGAELGMSASDCRSLMRVADDQLSEFVRRRYPRLSTTSGSATRNDPNAYSAGKVDGERIRLSKGVDGRATNRGSLLGPG